MPNDPAITNVTPSGPPIGRPPLPNCAPIAPDWFMSVDPDTSALVALLCRPEALDAARRDTGFRYDAGDELYFRVAWPSGAHSFFREGSDHPTLYRLGPHETVTVDGEAWTRIPLDRVEVGS